MSIRHLPAAVAAAMLAGFALAAPAVAQVSVQPAAAVTGMTSGRIGPSLTALVALAGVVIGRLALARSTGRIGTGNRGRMAIVAMVSGLIGVVVGGVLAATADGGPGTGNGIVASWAAMVLGLIGMVLGGLALARSRRTQPTG
ncbi:DUF6223 family protein [Nocardia sp. NBC_01730]|uniref:DUF6223 family protein n=1 Tax=Nocardia sp. NBC_01730 TaxID=2975998 RepID=UPI002E11F7B9|nr:DUF6223 family protein [Nocardia sp. NBC_01730]